MKKLILFFITLLLNTVIYSQTSNCTITKTNGMGFSTTIESVVNNCNGTYTIQLLFSHNGCGGPTCKELSHLSIEALPGTYSSISATKLNGSWTYGNLSLGPNLGSDSFQGFKFDNTSGIGDGQSGNVRIVYTLSGNLQQQRISAKAGTSGNIVTFTISDFTYVMNCNNTNCSINNDSDNDNCLDSLDQFPNDSNRCFSTIKKGSLAYEDLWPSKGDYDFNDLVIEYTFNTITNSNNFVVEIIASFKIKSFGAGYHNGFGFQLPNNIDQTKITASGMILTTNLIEINNNGLEKNQSKPTFIVFDNTYDIMKYPGSGIGVNTTPGAPYVNPVTINLLISFNKNVFTVNDINLNNFNPFIFVNKNRSHEIHLPYYTPTDKMNFNLFGVDDDNTIPNQNRYYVSKNNIPWGIHIQTEFDYPKEKIDIINTHLKFKEWAESSGELFNDWYLNKDGYRNNINIYFY